MQLVKLFWILLLPFVYSKLTDDRNANMKCNSDENCQVMSWIEPYSVCEMHQCMCHNSTCVHYTVSRKGSVNYFCGECGSVGSRCMDHPCKYPGLCSIDNYCHCSSGFLRKDICIYYDPVSSTRLNLTLIFVLLLLIVINRIVASWPFFRNLFRNIRYCNWCRNCIRREQRSESAQGINPASGTKSAAYTISSNEFLSTTNDPDLEWALELSLQLVNENPDSSTPEVVSVPGTSYENPENAVIDINNKKGSVKYKTKHSTTDFYCSSQLQCWSDSMECRCLQGMDSTEPSCPQFIDPVEPNCPQVDPVEHCCSQTKVSVEHCSSQSSKGLMNPGGLQVKDPTETTESCCNQVKNKMESNFSMNIDTIESNLTQDTIKFCCSHNVDLELASSSSSSVLEDIDSYSLIIKTQEPKTGIDNPSYISPETGAIRKTWSLPSKHVQRQNYLQNIRGRKRQNEINSVKFSQQERSEL